MKRLRSLRAFYALLLDLYPKKYRDEYRGELQSVFDLALDDAIRAGFMDVVDVLSRELMGLPVAILNEYLRERRKRKMTGKFASHLDFESGSRNEILATLLPFLLLTMISMLLELVGRIVDIPNWLEGVIAILMLVSFVGVFVVGFMKAVPRWFMPYLGFPLSIINLLAFSALMNPEWRGFPGLMQASWFIRQFVSQGLLWIGLFVLIILLVIMSAIINKFRPFYQRLKEDWTLLAFIIYGTAPFSVVLTFDDYQNEELYKILSFVILAIGGWFYLRNKSSWKRFWSLFIGLALSMFVAAIGKGILYAGPWPRPKFFTWQTEMLSTIMMWVWLALIMFLPLMLNLLPPHNQESKSSG